MDPPGVDRGRIRIPGSLLIYPERAYAPERPYPAGAVPRAHGLAPLAVAGDGTFLAAVAPGEGVWLGLEPLRPERPVGVRVRVLTGDEGAAAPPDSHGSASSVPSSPRSEHFACPPAQRLPGVAVESGRRLFGDVAGAGPLEVVELQVDGPAPVTVALVLLRPDAFERRTGVVPGPIDPDAAYGGWRLP